MFDFSYEYYRDSFDGDLSQDAFDSVLVAAMRHVRWLCGYREPETEVECEAYKRAVCAAVDVFANFGEGQVGGFSLGDFKVTNYENQGTTGEALASEAAIKELVGTRLLFCGVR